MDYKKMYEELFTEFNQYKKESIKWSVEDFLDFESETHTITPEQAQKTLELMISNHDSQYGVNWWTVEWYIQIYGTEK
jgi:hypothetical protein